MYCMANLCTENAVWLVFASKILFCQVKFHIFIYKSENVIKSDGGIEVSTEELYSL